MDLAFQNRRGRKKWKRVTATREDLRHQFAGWLDKRLVEKTSANYRQGWLAWTEYCHQFDIDQHVCDCGRLCEFSAWLADRRDVCATTMRQYGYGVRSELMKREIRIDISKASMPRWHAGLEGRARDDVESGRAKPPNHPITRAILEQWLEQMWAISDDQMCRWDKVVWTVFTLISQQSLRRSAEMVQEELGGLRFDMFRFASADSSGFPVDLDQEKWATLSFCGSKTTRKAARCREKQTAVLACHCQYGKYCALHRLIDLFACAPSTKPDDVVFRLSNGRRINYSMELEWIKERCVACGHHPKMYATHGFRSGGVIDIFDDRGYNPASRQYAKSQAFWRGDMDFYYDGKRTEQMHAKKALSIAGVDTSDFDWSKRLRMGTRIGKAKAKRKSKVSKGTTMARKSAKATAKRSVKSMKVSKAKPKLMRRMCMFRMPKQTARKSGFFLNGR